MATDKPTDVEVYALEDYLLGGGPRLTPREVEARAGADADLADRLWRAMGFPDVPDDVPAFTEDDVDALRRAVSLIALGIPADELVHVTRTVAQAVARIADTVVTEIAGWTAGFGDPVAKENAGEIMARLAPQLVPELDRLLVYLLHRHLVAAAAWYLATVDPDEPWPQLTVGFADLVGFTKLTQHLPREEMSRLVDEFHAAAADIVTEGGGRAVKTIGDAVLFTSEDVAAAAEIALALTDHFADDPDGPRVRVGLASGPVLVRLGDVFGPVVNLAARAVAVARPGTVLVASDMADELDRDERFQLRATRRRPLKGIGLVQLHALRRSAAA
ncbi:MAG: adenylate/guanylate cyclase domain-containing protein [Acidimicrobiales bacterium]